MSLPPPTASQLRAQRVEDAWTTYRTTHAAQTEALVWFVRQPSPESEAAYRDAAAAFRSAVYGRDQSLVSYVEHIVSEVQLAALAVGDGLAALTRRLEHLEQEIEAGQDVVSKGFDAVLARLPELREPGP